MSRFSVALSIALALMVPRSQGIPKFEVSSLSEASLVIRMIEATNVTSYDITVQIFDLSRQKLYRKTQLERVTNDQLLSFDGLKSSTWFAIRIEYRLNFDDAGGGGVDKALRTTKQEMVVKTKSSSREDPNKIDQMVAFIDDLFVTKDNIYIGVGSVFKEIKKISTVIVPELRCSKGVLSPVSQQVIQHASFHFDLSKLPKEDRKCSVICVFPYLRITIDQSRTETFRAKEWCGSVDEARHMLTTSASFSPQLLSVFLIFFILL
ncbi:unnamed protein product [Caenorhabditis bovis]|uniref:Uncharacterized protein n=1 Tax=Caenorhabditis bovis TaxID=2654633 RepID=A0A8S1F2G5_9PELO|nr:unnamed protein product [Caenorhabditis bovis]